MVYTEHFAAALVIRLEFHGALKGGEGFLALALVQQRPGQATEDDGPLRGNFRSLLIRVRRPFQVAQVFELELSLEKLLPPDELNQVHLAADRVRQAVVEQERILVVGDFDADGATSVALALSLLRAMGADHVDFLVPNRFEFGYGLSPDIVRLAAELKPTLLITVDNGVSSVDGVAAANRLGIDVIVTDHHLPGAVLPAALAIVNPNLPGCKFLSKTLAGVGVIYYLLSVVRVKLRQQGWFAQREMPNLADWLDLVALRYSVQTAGIDRLAVTKLDVLAGIDPLKICVAYELDGQRIEHFPCRADQLERCKPILEEVPGFHEEIAACRSFDQLPENARAYLERMTTGCGAGLGLVSVGPGREQTIEVAELWAR